MLLAIADFTGWTCLALSSYLQMNSRILPVRAGEVNSSRPLKQTRRRNNQHDAPRTANINLSAA
jgi:hypothetical protein